MEISHLSNLAHIIVVDRAIWDNYKVDYGDDIYSIAMETKIGLHWNFSDGHQPCNRKVL